MQTVIDIIVILGTGVATIYCYILGKRLKKFGDLDGGIGSAIAVLSCQVSSMKQVLDRANVNASSSNAKLDDTIERAEIVQRRLELLIASLHDLDPNIPKHSNHQENPSFVRSKVSSGGNSL